MPFPFHFARFAAVSRYPSLRMRVRYKLVESQVGTEHYEVKFIKKRSQKLEIKMPLLCNECGREYSRKRDGACGTCGSTEFIFELQSGRTAYIDFSDRFIGIVPT